MSVPRMRTVPAAYRALKEADPHTAITLCALRAMVNRGDIPAVAVGSKRLVNLDLIFERLASPSCSPKAKHEGAEIRPLA